MAPVAANAHPLPIKMVSHSTSHFQREKKILVLIISNYVLKTMVSCTYHTSLGALHPWWHPFPSNPRMQVDGHKNAVPPSIPCRPCWCVVAHPWELANTFCWTLEEWCQQTCSIPNDESGVIFCLHSCPWYSSSYSWKSQVSLPILLGYGRPVRAYSSMVGTVKTPVSVWWTWLGQGPIWNDEICWN